jgi:hypothetical protein
MNQFDLQFKILEKEIDHINDIASRMDNITQTTKNWAVVTWAGSIGLCLANQTLWQFIYYTGIFPLIFMFIDAHWRLLQGRSMYRSKLIQEFLNDKRLKKSIKAKKFVDFTVYDPAAKTSKNTPHYKKYVSYRKVLKYREILFFYLPLTLLSIAIFFILNFSDIKQIEPTIIKEKIIIIKDQSDK